MSGSLSLQLEHFWSLNLGTSLIYIWFNNICHLGLNAVFIPKGITFEIKSDYFLKSLLILISNNIIKCFAIEVLINR